MGHEKRDIFWKSVVILCPLTAITGSVFSIFVFWRLWCSYFLPSWADWVSFSSTCLDTAVWWANTPDTSILLPCTALSVSYCASCTTADKERTNRRDRFICSVMANLSRFSSRRNNMLWPPNCTQTCRCSLKVHFILKLYFPSNLQPAGEYQHLIDLVLF